MAFTIELDTLDHSLVANNGAKLGTLLPLHAAQNLALNKNGESLVQPNVVPVVNAGELMEKEEYC